ncbi:MAG: alpha/beta hydrolase [Thermodesulfobacteriota bacterium]
MANRLFLVVLSILIPGVFFMSLAGDALNRFIENQIFFPDRNLEYQPSQFGLDHQDVRFGAEDGVRLHGWFFPTQPSRAVFLFCHGNAGNISHRLDNIRRLHDLGLAVFIFDYRGYGNSEGQISEQGFYLDAAAAYQKGREYAEDLKTKLVIFGRSLGGIAAVHMASSWPCSGLILESTFPNLGAMAQAHFPIPMVHKTLQNRLNAMGEIHKVKAPILFFHGDIDGIVPLKFGRELYQAAPDPKEFVTLPGAGHNDTYLVAGQPYFDKIRSFVDGLPHRGGEFD